MSDCTWVFRQYEIIRLGWRWRIGHHSANDAWHFDSEIRYWRKLTALRAAQDMLVAYNDGQWISGARPSDGPSSPDAATPSGHSK